MKKVVGVFNFKGGVGKTFIASHLLFYLNKETDYKIYGLDTDIQADLMKWCSNGKWKEKEMADYKVNERFKLIWLMHPFVLSGGYPLPKDGIIIIDGRPDLECLAELLEVIDILLVPLKGRLSLDSALAMKKVISQMKNKKSNVKIYGVRNEILPMRVLASRGELLLFNVLDMNFIKFGITHTSLVRQAEEQYCPIWDLPNYRKGLTCHFVIQQLVDLILGKIKDKEIVLTYSEVAG